jgi:hypothetical protein
MAEEAGVTICYGSDLLISMHALQTEEFTVRSRVLSAAQILKHATINPGTLSFFLRFFSSFFPENTLAPHRFFSTCHFMLVEPP